MNTTIAIILTVVVTNWTYIGEFKDKNGRTFDVSEGQIYTNKVVDFEWRDEVSAEEISKLGTTALGLIGNPHTNRFVLKSIPGPMPDRRLTLITNIYFTNIQRFFTNQWITNKNPTYFLTNGYLMSTDELLPNK